MKLYRNGVYLAKAKPMPDALPPPLGVPPERVLYAEVESGARIPSGFVFAHKKAVLLTEQRARLVVRVSGEETDAAELLGRLQEV